MLVVNTGALKTEQNLVGLVLSLNLSLVSKVKQGKGGSSRDQEGHVEPAVVKVELQVTQDCGDY